MCTILVFVCVMCVCVILSVVWVFVSVVCGWVLCVGVGVFMCVYRCMCATFINVRP